MTRYGEGAVIKRDLRSGEDACLLNEASFTSRLIVCINQVDAEISFAMLTLAPLSRAWVPSHGIRDRHRANWGCWLAFATFQTHLCGMQKR